MSTKTVRFSDIFVNKNRCQGGQSRAVGRGFFEGKMVPDFLSSVLGKEAAKHPLFIVICIMAFGIGTSSLFNPFVLAEEFTTFQQNASTRLLSLETAVCTLQYTTEKNALESQVRAVSTEIFQLERLFNSGDATARDVQRVDALKTDRSKLDRELNMLISTHSCS